MSDYNLDIYNESQEYNDLDEIVNEFDAAMGEFDYYVQESVALKVIIGAAIVTALSGLIAFIFMHFSKKNFNREAENKKADYLTGNALKKAKKQAKSGKNKKVPKKKKKLNLPFFGGRKSISESYYQEAIHDDASSLVHVMEKEAEVIINSVEIVSDGMAINSSEALTKLQNYLTEAKSKKNERSDSHYEKLEMKDLISGVEREMSVDDIIEECEIILSFNKTIVAIANNMNRCLNKLNRMTGTDTNPSSARELKTKANQIIVPQIQKFQKRLGIINNAICEVMKNNIQALSDIEQGDHDFSDSVRAGIARDKYSDNTKGIDGSKDDSSYTVKGNNDNSGDIVSPSLSQTGLFKPSL